MAAEGVEQSRPAGLWEQVLILSQRGTGMYNVTSKLVLSSHSELRRQMVLTALTNLSRRHPLLRSTVREQNGHQMVFVTGNLEPVLRYSSHDEITAMESELSEVFDDQKYLWRVTMLDSVKSDNVWSNTFIFTFHHAIVDGDSVIQIYRDFLTYLEMALRNLDCDVISLPLKESRDVIFAQECECSWIKSRKYAVDYLYNDFLRPTWTPNPLVQRTIEALRPPNGQRRTKYLEINFNEEITSKMIDLCHSHRIRMNGFCSAVAAHAFRQLLLDYDVIKSGDVIDCHTECYVDLRRFTEDLSQNDVGLYITHLPFPVQLPEKEVSFWDDAKTFDSSLHYWLDSGRHFKELLKFQTAIRCIGADKVSKIISMTDHRSMPYYISNLGSTEIRGDLGGSLCRDAQIRGDVGGSLCEVESVHLTVNESMQLVDGSVFIHSLVTVNGRLCWTLGYHSHQVSDMAATRFRDLLHQQAYQACCDD